MRKIRLRLSDGYSYATEFTATAETFCRELRRAWLVFAARRGRVVRGRPIASAELQVHVEGNDWISPNYPRSNAPAHLQLGETPAADLFRRCAHSLERGRWFSDQVNALARFVTAPEPPRLRLIEGGAGAHPRRGGELNRTAATDNAAHESSPAHRGTNRSLHKNACKLITS